MQFSFILIYFLRIKSLKFLHQYAVLELVIIDKLLTNIIIKFKTVPITDIYKAINYPIRPPYFET